MWYVLSNVVAIACIVSYICIYLYEHTVNTCMQSISSIYSDYGTVLGLLGMSSFLIITHH